MRRRLSEAGVEATGIEISATDWETEKAHIKAADTIILGSSSTKPIAVAKFGQSEIRSSDMALFADNPLARSGSLVFNENDNSMFSPLPRNAKNVISDGQFARLALEYAVQLGKTSIIVSLRSPYDIVNYDDIADVAIAAYNYYGYSDGYMRSDTPRAIIDVILGRITPTGKVTRQCIRSTGRWLDGRIEIQVRLWPKLLT